MTTQNYIPPKQRIDSAEDRIEILEKELEAERRVSGQMAEMIFNFASRLSAVEQHQGVLRNIMARMAQRMEAERNAETSTLKPVQHF